MIIPVRVRPNARQRPSVVTQESDYIVTTNVEAKEGKANLAVQKLLASHFGIAKMRVRLVRGATSRLKTYEIDL